ncbi:hypothetical protein SCB29_40105, partial [Paraburkholderia sp. SIMBA_055]
RIQELDYLELEYEEKGERFDDRERLGLEAANRRLHSEMEGLATKIDMYLCDMHAITKLIEDARLVLNKQSALHNGDAEQEGQ